MKIIKHGKFANKVIVTCEECGCEFTIHLSECEKSKDPDFYWATCPECVNESILLKKKDFQTELYKKEK